MLADRSSSYIINLCLYFCIAIAALSCKTDNQASEDISVDKTIVLDGRTMGTTYHIVYIDSKSSDHQAAIDSILIDINQAVSTYIPESVISQINNDSLGKKITILKEGEYIESIKYEFQYNAHFAENYISSHNVFLRTVGYFDPTVMPLVNYWGFGYTDKKAVTEADSTKIKKIMTSVGFNSWSDQVDSERMQYIKPINAQLDFSAIAKGYAVDKISEFLELNNIKNYIVEIGGEVYCKGQKANNKNWTIALSKPKINAAVTDVEMAVVLDGVGLASSGNYRNFYEVEDNIYGHEINPHTGFSEMNDLLGVSVISSNCMIADAYATAFMVMGREKSIELIERLADTEAIFFHSSPEKNIIHTQSSGFHQYMVSQ